MRVLQYFKSFTEAAIAIGVSREAVRKWVRDGVPAERVLPICEATGWRVTPHQLRPDLYPNRTDAMPMPAFLNEAETV
jgi:DNA-binding transcriptional regulator YdaS (Cro superfamily)